MYENLKTEYVQFFEKHGFTINEFGEFSFVNGKYSIEVIFDEYPLIMNIKNVLTNEIVYELYDYEFDIFKSMFDKNGFNESKLMSYINKIENAH